MPLILLLYNSFAFGAGSHSSTPTPQPILPPPFSSTARISARFRRNGPLAIRDGHIPQALQVFKGFDNRGHFGPVFRVQADALMGQKAHFSGPLNRVLARKPGVHYKVQSSATRQIGPGPIHQILLVLGPGFVHCSSPCKEF